MSLNNTPPRILSLILAWLSFAVFGLAQAPSLPDGLACDPRLTWRPTLNPTATVVLDSLGNVTSWRTGAPVVVPTAGRAPITVALEQLENNKGEWLGFYGRHGAVKLGARTDKDESARPQGFQGISVVGLDPDSHSSTGAVLAGINLAQYVGVQRDLAFLRLTVDSWTNRPCTLAAGAHPTFGHVYLEDIEVLAIGRKWQNLTDKGGAVTTWVLRAEGHAQLHVLRLRMVGGVLKGDGKAGTVEHGIYANGPAGDSEVLDSLFEGCGISATYFVTRYADRIDLLAGTWAERYGHGALLVDNLTALECGPNGSFAFNVCGGALHVVLRNFTYEVNQGAIGTAAPWAGGAVQFYTDHKAYELVPPINSNSVPVALGYSMDTHSSALPMSPGVAALVASGALPWDDFGAARSLHVIGGTFRVANLKPPLFNLRDVGLVMFTQLADGVEPFSVTGLGNNKVLAFASSGVWSQCGPAQAEGQPPGQLPAQFGAAWNQQARFYSRRPPDTWLGGRVTVNGTNVPAADLATWMWRP